MKTWEKTLRSAIPALKQGTPEGSEDCSGASGKTGRTAVTLGHTRVGPGPGIKPALLSDNNRLPLKMCQDGQFSEVTGSLTESRAQVSSVPLEMRAPASPLCATGHTGVSVGTPATVLFGHHGLLEVSTTTCRPSTGHVQPRAGNAPDNWLLRQESQI